MLNIPLIQLPKGQTKGYDTACLYVGCSTYDEPPNKAGINHLLEHVLMCNDNIDNYTGKLGLETNAETHGGYVRFWFSAPRKHLDFCINYLKKIGSRPSFLHIKRESDAIRQELISVLEETEYYSDYATLKRLFPDSGYLRGNDVKLMLKTLPKISKKSVLEKYFRENYLGKMFIVVSSSAKIKGAVKLNKLPKKYVAGSPKMSEKRGSEIIHIKRPEVEKSQCSLIFYKAFSSVKTTEYHKISKEHHTLCLTTRILSNGLDSLLYKVLREKLRLVYSVSCETEIEPFGVLTEIKWSCDTNKVDKCVENVFKVLDKFKTHHFRGHKNLYLEQLRRNNLLTSKDIVDIYGEHMVLWGKYETVENILKRVKKIGRKDVINSVKKYFDRSRCFLIHISSRDTAPRIRKFASLK